MANTAQQYWDSLGYGLWGNSAAPLSWDQLGADGQKLISDYYASTVAPEIVGMVQRDIMGNTVQAGGSLGDGGVYETPGVHYEPDWMFPEGRPQLNLGDGGAVSGYSAYRPEQTYTAPTSQTNLGDGGPQLADMLYGMYGGDASSYGLTQNQSKFTDDQSTALTAGLRNQLTLDGYTGETRLPQASALYAINPELAESLGITRQMAIDFANQQDAIQSEAAREDKSAADRQGWLMAISTIGTGVGLGYLGYGDAAAGAGAYSAGGGVTGTGGLSGAAGYTGTASELAADGLGGVDMAGGSTAYYDAGAGMWVDSATGEGIASGTAVPEGYTAAEGSSAIAAADAAPAAANEPGILDSLQEWYKEGNNAKTVADALKSFTNSSTQQGSSAYSPLDSFDSGGTSPVSGGVTSGSGQSQLLETQPQSSGQSYSLPTQQQASSPLGMIDVTPANNTFLQAGSTWNQQMANALRKRNAY